MTRPFALLLALPLVLAFLAGCIKAPPSSSDATATTCDGVTRDGLGVPAGNTIALLSTSKGCIVAELYDDKTPITVANFRTYAEETFFDGVLFHRIAKDFMVQTGGMGTDGKFKTATHPMIQNEARSSGLKNLAYTLSMARTQAADSATNQFFINHKDNPNLDPTASSAGYAVFGKVVKGQSVVDSIASTPVTMYNAPGANTHCQGDQIPSCPTSDVVLEEVRLL